MATRRSDNGAAFDHGAQYFTVRDKQFQNCVDSWQHAGLVQRWNGRIVSRHDQNTEQDKSSTARFVACPGMNAICRHLAENLDIRTNTRVAPPTRCQGKSLVSDATGSELGRYDVVIVSRPPHRLESFFRDRTTGQPRVVRQDRRLLGIVGPVSRSDRCRLRRRFVQDSAFSWIARNSSKPGRNPDVETWILHASADWTQCHLEEPPVAIQERLLDAFWDATGVAAVPPSYVVAHRSR